MEPDLDLLDEMTLALLHLTTWHEHGGHRTWKGHDFEVMGRLHAKGWIDNPVSKARSVTVTPEGAKLSAKLFEKHFLRGSTKQPALSLALVALLVPDYDEAIAYFTQTLGFTLKEDEPRPDGKRWVVVAPGSGTGLLLAQAEGPQAKGIGHQFAGRVGLFLHTTDFAATYERFGKKGVEFVEEPRSEAYGTVVVFEDRYGNRWDLIEPKA